MENLKRLAEKNWGSSKPVKMPNFRKMFVVRKKRSFVNHMSTFFWRYKIFPKVNWSLLWSDHRLGLRKKWFSLKISSKFIENTTSNFLETFSSFCFRDTYGSWFRCFSQEIMQITSSSFNHAAEHIVFFVKLISLDPKHHSKSSISTK